MSDAPRGGKIKVLPPLLAQKIAAGEVIERPQSVVRELIDNAVDSGSRNVDVFLRGGGTELVAVQDDGCGMDADDVAVCWLPHTTSKISTEDDLRAIRTMGFRGEALSSIATVSRLTVLSATSTVGTRLEVVGGQQTTLEAWGGRPGTRVECANLFFNLPARLQFLKRAGSEFVLCRTVFLEKALAHPGVAFRLYHDDELSIFLPALSGDKVLRDRFAAINRQAVPRLELLHQIEARHPEATITLVLGTPDLYQHDRKLIQVHVNRRRINEFGLVQAIEAGYAGFLPGGRFPVAAVFLEVDPDRVDVNIHPAKREVKLLDFRRIHELVVRMVQDFLRIGYRRNELREARADFAAGPALFAAPAQPPVARADYDLRSRLTLPEAVAERPMADRRFPAPLSAGEPASTTDDPKVADSATSTPAPRYLGQVFGVFVLAQVGDQLMMMDFHAAHERVLYDRFRSDRRRQPLLVPLELHPADAAEGAPGLELCRDDLAERGVVVGRTGTTWRLEAVPVLAAGLVPAVVEFLESELTSAEDLERRLYATMACRAARKDGDLLTAQQAQELLEQALSLPEQRCPHGRPIFFSLSRDELFELVGRTV